MTRIRRVLRDPATGEFLGAATVASNASPETIEMLTAMAKHVHVRASLGLPITNDEYWRGTPDQRAHWDRVWREFQASQQDTPTGYAIHPDPDAPAGYVITCHRCGLTSANPNDVSNKFCGFCHRFHEDDT